MRRHTCDRCLTQRFAPRTSIVTTYRHTNTSDEALAQAVNDLPCGGGEASRDVPCGEATEQRET